MVSVQFKKERLTTHLFLVWSFFFPSAPLVGRHLLFFSFSLFATVPVLLGECLPLQQQHRSSPQRRRLVVKHVGLKPRDYNED